MEAIRHPVGDLPPEVYWRRRVIVLAFGVLALVVLYYLLKSAFDGGEPGPSPTPDVTPSVSPSPSESFSGEPPCGVADLLINLSPISRDFPDPGIPSFQATVTHTGLADCVLDPRAPETELLITSGSDRIWSNLDCAQSVLDGTSLLLSPNETVTLTAGWPRIRSDESCSLGLQIPLPGTYHALLTLQGVESTDAVFSLSD
ncbi:MAG: hypothetical protein MUP36_02925 [Demequinaceae bacterium]|nr:hypothetical protein [Demequinaceae bacterium]